MLWGNYMLMQHTDWLWLIWVWRIISMTHTTTGMDEMWHELWREISKEHSHTSMQSLKFSKKNINVYCSPLHDVIKWKHFPHYWPFVRGIHWSPVNSPHKGQWCRALMFFDLRLNKQLSKQPWCWWFQMPLHSLWRHCNDTKIFLLWPKSYGNFMLLSYKL